MPDGDLNKDKQCDKVIKSIFFSERLKRLANIDVSIAYTGSRRRTHVRSPETQEEGRSYCNNAFKATNFTIESQDWLRKFVGSSNDQKKLLRSLEVCLMVLSKLFFSVSKIRCVIIPQNFLVFDATFCIYNQKPIKYLWK